MNGEKKYLKLALSILFDIIGYASFIIPGVGELIDIVWAPLAAYCMTKMYKGTEGKVAAVISFLEEAMPGLDVIPTFSIMWIYTYILNPKKKEKSKITKTIEV